MGADESLEPTPPEPSAADAEAEFAPKAEPDGKPEPDAEPSPESRAAAGEGPGEESPVGATKRRFRRRRRALIAVATVLIVFGAVLGAGAYYYDSVSTGDPLRTPASTILYYANGEVLARLGTVERYPVKYAEISDTVSEVAVAAEDPGFWTNHGGAIARAVVRQRYDLRQDSANARLRVAVLAWKIEDELSKEEILEYYLNSVPFGRNTYGFEAAAQAYFGKTVKKSAPRQQQINDAQAMALISMVKQPEPDPDNPDEYPGYDPTRSDKAKQNAIDRWNDLRGQMVALNKQNPGRYLTPEENATIQFPPIDTWKPYAPNRGDAGRAAPGGLVVNHVLDELTHGEGFFKGKSWQSIEEGGYSIYTTLDPRAQATAEAIADETVSGSVMNGQPANLQASIVAIEPGTGRVLAYYGGHDGVGNDYAGIYRDEKNEAVGLGRYPPGSAFFVHTLAAALKAGISLESKWQWTEHEQPGRPQANPIRNASACGSDYDPNAPARAKTGACTLLESTVTSLNVPFYDVTLSATPVKVLEMARDAGIDFMWNDERARQDLRVTDMRKLTPSQFDIVLGIGQYPVTVVDQANAMATYAAKGVRAQAHFVGKVTKDDHVLHAESLPGANQARVISPQVSADLNYALSQAGPVLPGMDSAGKTGTWEYNARVDQNAHAWMTGYTSELAVAVYVGNRADERALIDRNGATVWGSGLPNHIYRAFMIRTHEQMGLRPETFDPPAFIGNLNPPLSVPG